MTQGASIRRLEVGHLHLWKEVNPEKSKQGTWVPHLQLCFQAEAKLFGSYDLGCCSRVPSNLRRKEQGNKEDMVAPGPSGHERDRGATVPAGLGSLTSLGIVQSPY